MMNRIVFIVPQLSQPRTIKRIESIRNSGVDVKVYGFDNGLYNCNIDNLSFPIYELIMRLKEVGRKDKMIFFIKTIRRILKENREGTVFYFFGYEMAAIAYLLGCKNYVYEEADVSAARVKNSFVRSLMLSLDRAIINHSKFTVFTSGGFVNYIFGNRKFPENYILLPNKLSPYFNEDKKKEVIRSSINYQSIKFGFIGLIRYPNTIIRFAKVIGKYFSQHEFHFYGDIERKEYLDNEVKSYSNIYFHGPFLNPTDLNRIYASIDVNIVCYDTSSGNVKIAEPNKLYESIFFETPIVVSKGTYLAEQVYKENAGNSIDASSDESIIEYVKSLNDGFYDGVITQMIAANVSNLIDNPIELITNIKNLCYETK